MYYAFVLSWLFYQQYSRLYNDKNCIRNVKFLLWCPWEWSLSHLFTLEFINKLVTYASCHITLIIYYLKMLLLCCLNVYIMLTISNVDTLWKINRNSSMDASHKYGFLQLFHRSKVTLQHIEQLMNKFKDSKEHNLYGETRRALMYIP